MMGVHQPQAELFSYKVNLDKRVRADPRCAASPQKLILLLCGLNRPAAKGTMAMFQPIQ
jgi:hypothetical protein